MHPIVLLTCCALVIGGCGGARPERKPEAAPAASAPEDSPAAEVTQPSENVGDAVEHLLGLIQASPLVFIRNGSEHDGAAAAAHIRGKYEHYKKEIGSAEDFISKAATKSELSGKPYLVKLADGRQLPLSEWLTARLAEWRSTQTR
jgi:hypothetical protein